LYEFVVYMVINIVFYVLLLLFFILLHPICMCTYCLHVFFF